MWPFFYVSQIRHWTFEQKTYDRRYYAQKQNIPSDKDQGLEGKPENFSQFLFDQTNNTTIVSYVPKKNRQAVLLSTLYQGTEIVAVDTNKPEIIQFYNETKSGVDQVIRNDTFKRRTNRWPQCLLYNILDTSAYNAYFIYIYIILWVRIPMRR